MSIMNTNINITEYDNGVTTVCETLNELQSFTLGFWFNTGSRDETTETNGISHFIEHTLFKGTKKRSAKKISDEIEQTGGYLNAFTTKEHTCYYGRGIAGTTSKMFSVLSDMVQNPLFKEKELKKEGKVILDELYDILDTPEEFIFDEFEQLLFGSNPLAFPIIGEEDNIAKFNHELVSEYFMRKYFSGKLLIVASGNIDNNELTGLTHKFINKSYSHVGKPKRKKPRDQKPKTKIIEHPVNQFYSIIGSSSVGYSNPDYYTLRLLSIILGEGSSSRLFQSLREKSGIAYQINTFVNSYSDVSAFGTYFSTNRSNREKAKEIILEEFQKFIDKGVTERELEKARKIFIGNTILSIENTSSRMNRLANSYLLFKRIKPLEESINEISRITPSDILTLGEKILAPNSFSEVSVVPKE
jgi:predicted Zn-dependent peptidase